MGYGFRCFVAEAVFFLKHRSEQASAGPYEAPPFQLSPLIILANDTVLS